MNRHKNKSSASRNVRLAEQIQKDLAQLIQKELGTRAGLITLTGVELSPDYAHAKVFFTVLGAEPAEAQEALNEKAGYLHALLFKLLHIHTVPTLHFHHDDQLIHGMQMSQLIDRANNPGNTGEQAEVATFDLPKVRG